MPATWIRYPDKAPASPGAFSFEAGDPPLAELHLWPHRSLPAKGFAWVIGIAAGFLALPLLPLIGTPLLWALLPFLLGVLALLWLFLRRSYRGGWAEERMAIWADRMHLTHRDADGAVQSWEANPYWVRLKTRPDGGPVKNYLTLDGGPRRVELGRFLSEDERLTLRTELGRLLARLRSSSL